MTTAIPPSDFLPSDDSREAGPGLYLDGRPPVETKLQLIVWAISGHSCCFKIIAGNHADIHTAVYNIDVSKEENVLH